MAVAFEEAATGIAASSAAASMAVPLDFADLNVGDLILVHTCMRANNRSFVAPDASWVDVSAGPLQFATAGRSWVWAHIVDGTEGATADFTYSQDPDTSVRHARAYRFSGNDTDLGTAIGGLVSMIDTTQAVTPGYGAGSIASVPAGAMVCNFLYTNDDNTIGPFTGETGGDWIEPVEEYAVDLAFDGMQQIQVATMPSGGTLSGGSVNMSAADPWGSITFYIVAGGGGGTEYTDAETSTGASSVAGIDLFNPQVGRAIVQSNRGAWIGDGGETTDLHLKIDEVTPNDADFIQSEVSPVDSPSRYKITNLGDPESSFGHSILWRPGKDVTGDPQIDMTVSIYQGGGTTLGAGTLIASFTRGNVDALTLYEETLTDTQIDTITNYADLYAEFEANEVSSGGGGTGATAISTGAILGGGRDVRKLYISYDDGDTWEETYSRSPSLSAAQGKMVTARWAMACFFNDASGSNPQDMTEGDADANAAHFRDQIQVYREHGVLALSCGMEGGNAQDFTSDPDIDQTGFAYTSNNGSPSAFTSDGTALKATHKARWEALIEAADAQGVIICLTLFYSRQGGYLSSQTNYENAIITVSDWLKDKGYKNVCIDVANESGADPGGSWPTGHLFRTDSGTADMVQFFIDQWDGEPWRPAVGSSSRSKPGPLVLAASDIHWFHGNVAGTPAPGNRDDWCQDMLDDTTVGPVVCNEDETQAEENGGANSTKLTNELICFDAMNDIAGVSGGTMLAKPWQRWDSSTTNPFRPEPGASTDPDTGTYWERWANYTLAWLEHVEAETGGLPPRP